MQSGQRLDLGREWVRQRTDVARYTVDKVIMVREGPKGIGPCPALLQKALTPIVKIRYRPTL